MSEELPDPNEIGIIHFPHPTLRIEAKPLKRVDALLKKVVARMFDLMYEHRGVGLAATQVDIPLRLFVMNATGEKGEGEELAILNPVISKPKSNEEAEEGCLSLPGVHANVIRSKTIHLNAFEVSGKEIDSELSGFEARVVQHETDHLDGKLFIDRLKDGVINELAGELDALDTDFRSRQRTGAVASDEELLARTKAWEKRYC